MLKPKDKDSSKKLYVNFEEINTKTKALYSFLLVLGISASFALVGYHIYPIYAAGEMAFHVYLAINAAVAVGWVAFINIVNKFVLQNKLINKGTTNVSC